MALSGGITPEDLRILRFISKREMITDPKTVAVNLSDIGGQKVRNRMQAMLKNGLLKRPDDVPDGFDIKGLYVVTELGHDVAGGELTIDEYVERAQIEDRD